MESILLRPPMGVLHIKYHVFEGDKLKKKVSDANYVLSYSISKKAISVTDL